VRQRLEKLLETVDRLTLRERLSLFAALLAVMGGAWEAMLAAPLDVHAAGARIEALQQRLATLNESIAAAAEGENQDMPIELDRLNSLRDRVAKGDAEVKLLTSDLVDPKQMRSVLEELIRRQSGLRLISATNLAPQPLFEDAAAPAGEGETTEPPPVSDAPKLFRHTLVLKLEGSYLDCVAYLEAVERLPWRLYWGRIEVESGDYPKNAIVIELRTLSLDQEWIGV
jgi:MSHA biogenesis protein MshJ